MLVAVFGVIIAFDTWGFSENNEKCSEDGI